MSLISVDFARPAIGYMLTLRTVAQDGGAVADGEHLVEVVRDVDDADAVGPERPDDVEDGVDSPARRTRRSARRG